MLRALVAACLLGACTGTLGGAPPGDPTAGDPTAGDSTSGDSTAGDPGGGGGDPTAGDPAGDPIAGDPAANGDPMAGDPAANGDPTIPPQPQSCADKSAAIVASTGNTILVSPAGPGEVTVGGNTTTLRQVVSGASSGDTILLADGTYTFRESTGDTDYTGLYFTTANITMRGQSGDPTAVVLDSNYADHGGSTGVITVAAAGIVLADLTVRESIFHLIHLQSAGDDCLVHNVHLIDGGQQFLKASGTEIDNGEVSCCRFVMTANGRDNVWGYGATDGGTRCYTGGIDTHDSRDWWVHDSYFEGIYCNAGGVERPAHGKKGELRDNLTYTGGLSEHAIHMWDAVAGHGHVVERNRIVNCARGIGIGMAADVYDTVVRNNMVFSEHAGSAEHDVGINIDRGHDSQIANNTVFFSSGSAYSNAIEYRWSSTTGLEVRNNLTNQNIQARDGAAAGTTTSTNVTNAQTGWFVDAAAGDLHLSACDLGAVDGAGTALGYVTDDFDQDARPDTDVGADQCQ